MADHSLEQSMITIYNMAEQAILARLNDQIKSVTGLVVQAGPFSGLRLRSESSWGDGDITSKLLGFYEQELHPFIQQVLSKEYSALINVGAAEGYYAVGFKRLRPEMMVYAFDISAKAREVMALTAQDNDIHEKLEIHGACSIQQLNTILVREEKVFLLLDCEGCELSLLDPAVIPALSHCDFLVECHDFYNRSITPTLVDRFMATHQLFQIREGPRDPNASPFLTTLSASFRWLAVNEHRPETMHWLLGWANRE